MFLGLFIEVTTRLASSRCPAPPSSATYSSATLCTVCRFDQDISLSYVIFFMKRGDFYAIFVRIN